MVKFIRNKVYILMLLIFGVLLTACSSTSQKVSGNQSERVKAWTKDIDYLYNNLPKSHKNLYHNIKEEDFKKEIISLKQDIEKLKDYEIKCRLAQIVATVGDAHTSVNLGFNNSNVYPVVFWWFQEDLRAVATLKEQRDILGKKLIGINNMPIKDVMKKVNSLIPHENEQWLRATNIRFVTMPEVLKVLGIASDDKVEFSLSDDSNNVTKLELTPEGLPDEKITRVIDEMPTKPLRLQYNTNSLSERLYWYKYLPEEKLLYFQYNQCIDRRVAKSYGIENYKDYPEFWELSQGLLKVINDNNLNKFVVDLRFNSGGDSSLMTGLVNKLASIDKLKGKIHVIIGRETFSSGVMAAMDLMNQTKAVFYGEPSGGNVNGYGDIKTMELPNSKLQISYSTKYFKLSSSIEKNFLPDVSVEQSYNNYKQGIDEVFEAVRNRKN